MHGADRGEHIATAGADLHVMEHVGAKTPYGGSDPTPASLGMGSDEKLID
jgi:hypothetical protein